MFFVTFSSAEQIDLNFSSLLVVLEDNYNGLFIDVSLVTLAVLSVLSALADRKSSLSSVFDFQANYL